jgi:hypothetical protein
MRFTSLFAIAATLSTTVLSVHADQKQHQHQKQQPVSVYLHPSPQGQHEHDHDHQVPTLTGEQAHMVLSHHFGLAGQGHSAAANNNEGEKKKGLWSHLLKPHGRPTLQSPERAKIIVIQGDLVPSDVLPVTSSEDLAGPAFHLASFPSYETMHFLQPYLAAGERAVQKFLGAVEDGVEHGFDRIWNEVTAGSEDKRGLKSLLDVTDSRKFASSLLYAINSLICSSLSSDTMSYCAGLAQTLHAQLSALSQLVHPSTSAKSDSDQVWESTVVHVPGRRGAEGEEEELRQTGLSFVRASVQAVSLDLAWRPADLELELSRLNELRVCCCGPVTASCHPQLYPIRPDHPAYPNDHLPRGLQISRQTDLQRSHPDGRTEQDYRRSPARPSRDSRSQTSCEGRGKGWMGYFDRERVGVVASVVGCRERL